MTSDLDVIMSERQHLINLAYRLLGSLTDAEDVVQETYARWYTMSREQQDAIDVPGAWLTTVASRICLNLLSSARVRRETYMGEWIPEPLPSSYPSDDPADRVTLDESVTMAFLVVLELMTPAERVALVLHDVFGYPFADVADVVGRSPAACRQLATSARRRLRASTPLAFRPSRQGDVVRAFKEAWEARDIEALIAVLDPAATVVADGGGLVSALLEPMSGGGRIARFLVDLVSGVESPVTLLERTVNAQPGLVAEYEGEIAVVYAFEVADNRITRIWAVRNPEKLRPWTGGGGA